MWPLRIERTEILFHRGDVPRGFYIVVYGQVKLSFSTARGDESSNSSAPARASAKP